MANIRIPKNYEQKINKAIHDLDKEVRYTGHCGLNVPVRFKRIYPNDNFRMDVSTLLQTSALQAPLMGRFKLRTMMFFEPFSNLYGWYDNNTKTSTEDLLEKQHWTYSYTGCATATNTYNPFDDNPTSTSPLGGFPRGSVLDFIGVPPGGVVCGAGGLTGQITITIDRILAYLDVIRTYMANSQEDFIPYYGYSGTSANKTPILKKYLRSDLDQLFMDLRYQKNGGSISSVETPAVIRLIQYLEDCNSGPHAGLFCATYEPDYYNNFLAKKVGQVRAEIDTSEGTFSIHEMYFQNAKQLLIDRFDVSGGTFSAWSRSVWGSRASRSADVPDVIGSVTTIIDPRNITAVANAYSNTPGEDSRVGDLYGQINSADTSFRKKYKFILGSREDGILIVLQQLIPCTDYSQGIDIELLRTNFLDEYYPQFAQIGFQSIPKSVYSMLPALDDGGKITTFDENNFTWNTGVAKQVAWLDSMTDTNRVHGEFSNFGRYEYWVLKRRFSNYKTIETDGTLRDSSFGITAYIDPLDWQYMFAAQTLSDPNYFFQVNLKTTALRPIGKRFMPAFQIS